MTKRPKRKRCTFPGCKKLQISGALFCKGHLNGQEATEEAPDDKVVKLSERDALRFGKIDAEVRNALQGQQLVDYKITEIQQKTRAQVTELQAAKARLIALVKSHEHDYRALVEELAETYGIDDPKNMAIDPDNGTVRDLRNT